MHFLLVCYRKADLIVEVCHPQIVKDFGVQFLSAANVLVILFYVRLLI